MKMIKRLITVGATVLLLALPGVAKNLTTPDTLNQDQCTQENKDAWYATFREKFKTDQQSTAYDAAKKYLTACSAEETDITKYLKKWVGAYEKEIRKVKFTQLLYTDNKYPEAYALGKEILADEPDNLKVLIDLGASGYLVAVKNPTLNADALNYAKKAMQLLGEGKTVEKWQPFSGAPEALAYLNYTVGTLTLEQDPSTALTYLIKALQTQTQLNKSPLPYAYLGGAYESGPYAKQHDEYQKLYTGQNETPESKLALANINQIVDRMIDAYARAVAAAGTNPLYQTQKPTWMESLATWYKYRHNQSDAGMNEMVASILSKPLPPVPTPLTSLPASTPAATPAGNSGTPNNSGAPSGMSADKPATPGSVPAVTQTNKPATTPAAGANTKATGTKTTPATGPGRPRSNHKRN